MLMEKRSFYLAHVIQGLIIRRHEVTPGDLVSRANEIVDMMIRSDALPSSGPLRDRTETAARTRRS